MAFVNSAHLLTESACRNSLRDDTDGYLSPQIVQLVNAPHLRIKALHSETLWLLFSTIMSADNQPWWMQLEYGLQIRANL